MGNGEEGVVASVGIVTDDAEELLAFYRSGLGFRLESTSEFPRGTVHRLQRRGAHCKIYVPTEKPSRGARPDPWFARSGIVYAALLVPDVATTVASARAAGAEVLTPPTSHRPGAVFALIADPQGNVWEILEESRAVASSASS